MLAIFDMIVVDGELHTIEAASESALEAERNVKVFELTFDLNILRGALGFLILLVALISIDIWHSVMIGTCVGVVFGFLAWQWQFRKHFRRIREQRAAWIAGRNSAAA